MISSLESHIEKFSYRKVAIIGAFRQGRKYNFKMIDLQVTEFDYISAVFSILLYSSRGQVKR